MNDEQNQANLNSAANLAKTNLGLVGVENSEWSQAERVAYLNEFRRIVLSYPQNFDAATLATVDAIHTATMQLTGDAVYYPNTDIDADWFDVGAFPGAFNGEAVDFINAVFNRAGEIAVSGLGAAGITAGLDSAKKAVISLKKTIDTFSAIAPWILPFFGVLLLYMATRSASDEIASVTRKPISSGYKYGKKAAKAAAASLL